ncbi:zinc-dependent alcohol dehydrogenase family protein [Pseudomonas chlororaphis]|uniref:zinc-dependent alcohol dehydrogenase family protein n=1 Tax=Pseudomonas chlororaphis TaxID=587753 RepID=UPI001B30DA7A|nr:zinc-dependent alcohol dehydrogenase family protein [Pseudomonas chlororaphis]MBP5059202.1 zinc-dependent alcohol dehydrogenase family protein [Pseudomonas chlororaphis]MBP5142975.1 zinc-dependent alcohol dehydrogenase family protein [Pseudomonas chlororaphis]QTT98291.1 zinc-dependent alcohol dehydrogenase family protein [Pseudomonas chlororaphis]
MKALQISRYGDPLDVLELVELPEPDPAGREEALLEVLYSPINPYDLNTVRGRVMRPQLPASLGTEGLARVLETGEGVTRVQPGDLVFVPGGSPTWVERLVVSADKLLPLPAWIDLQQLSMAAVNPPTAALLLDNFVALKPGDWIVQNAGNSSVATSVIAIAKARGYRTVNIVRRPEVIPAVEALGADVVLEDGDDLAAKVAEATGNAPIRLGLDGVGGASLASVSKLVEFGGMVVVYSAMSGEPGLANPMDVIFRDVTIRGFFLGHPHIRETLAAGLREGLQLIAEGKLRSPIGGTYSLADYREAVAASGKGTKILFKMPAADSGLRVAAD